MDSTPIVRLIDERCRALGIDETELARRLPFKHTSKTRRRLMELRGGRTNLPHLIAALPDALEVPPEAVVTAIIETRRLIDEEMDRRIAERDARLEAAWQASFVPHAMWLVERRVPVPIYQVAFAGTDVFLRHNYPDDLPAADRLSHALAAIPDHAGPFGAVLGVALNHTPDAATLYDRKGAFIENRDEAVRAGSAKVVFGSGAIIDRMIWSGTTAAR